MKLRSAALDDVHLEALVEYEESRGMIRLINLQYGWHHAALRLLIRWRLAR